MSAGNRTLEQIIGELEFDPQMLKQKYERERDKRLVGEGQGQYAPAIDGKFAQFGRDPWTRSDFNRAPMMGHTEVIIAGGGFGGLLMGARLHEMGVADIRVIDEAGDFGGTWYWNRYPGAMCDIEAHIYMPLLEETGHAPKHRYAYWDEMLELSQKIGRLHGLYDKACWSRPIAATA